MKKYIPDSLALFRIFSAPVILYLLLLDGTDKGLMWFQQSLHLLLLGQTFLMAD